MIEPVPGCEAQAIGMIGVIRSLGRAGYQVHACDQHADALGFSSRYAQRAERHPPCDTAEFIGWLNACLDRRHIRDTAVKAARKLGALGGLIGRSLQPDVHSDLRFPGNRGVHRNAWLRIFGRSGCG